jgi:hypothetical protein
MVSYYPATGKEKGKYLNKFNTFVEFEVLTAVTTKGAILYRESSVVLQKYTDVSEERTASASGSKIKPNRRTARIGLKQILELEAVSSSETSVNFY